MEEQFLIWLKADAQRLAALERASELRLRDWCLAAGFVRNLVWDRLHEYAQSTPLDDIDLVYFDPQDSSPERDRMLEARLREVSDLPWSVKNQARMHVRNADAPYVSTADAMSFWVEVETAIGVRLVGKRRELEFVAPLGLEALFAGSVTLNRKRPKPDAFKARIETKGWLKKWPRLIIGSGLDGPVMANRDTQQSQVM
uniref:nucleotidyltransferase family protein n=1 Tax=Halomonas sp. TaxID=1486246 RepID=UPI002608BD66|nr:nucleotidyltransferase family protein [Halomonas sp.]